MSKLTIMDVPKCGKMKGYPHPPFPPPKKKYKFCRMISNTLDMIIITK
jgi:hypothetical protein